MNQSTKKTTPAPTEPRTPTQSKKRSRPLPDTEDEEEDARTLMDSAMLRTPSKPTKRPSE
jgi:hypothetical protein